MKKIAVITMHFVKNYGSVLQTYATQTIFEKLGYECNIIDYWRKGDLDENLLNSWSQGRSILAKIVMIPTINKWKKVFNSFLSEYIILTKNKYIEGKNDFDINPVEADIYCVGSDQVWNTTYNGKLMPEFFLDFSNSPNKFAFSSSIGKTELNDEEKAFFKEKLEKFKAISVREESAVSILNELGLKNIYNILDPTLFLNDLEWDKVASPRVIKKKYCLIYQLNGNKQFDQYAKKFAKKNNLKLVRLCTRYDQFLKTGKGIFPNVNEFVSLFKYADYILTDSFHGTAFSINLNKNFSVIYPKRYSTRLESILDLTNLKDRVVNDCNNFNLRNIDYTNVNLIMNKKRKESYDWISNTLNLME